MGDKNKCNKDDKFNAMKNSQAKFTYHFIDKNQQTSSIFSYLWASSIIMCIGQSCSYQAFTHSKYF